MAFTVLSWNVEHFDGGTDARATSVANQIQQFNPDLIAIFEICMYLGVEKAEPTNTGGTIATDDFDVTFVRADHSSSTIVDGNFVYLGNPCGLVITPKDGPAVYHMGDTDIFGDMALINELYRPEIGIVPMGDRFTMGARSAALACN